MARRRASASPTASRDAVGQTPGLAVHPAGARAQELLRERSRLLREIQKKQQQLAQVRQKASTVADEAVSKMAPLIQRQHALALELEALFDELLELGRLSARARSQVARLRRALELQGLLHPKHDDDGESARGHQRDQPDRDQGGDPWDRPPRHASQARPASPGAAEAPPEVDGARQVGQARRSLRDIFRSLARAVHPDQARQEGERQRRTEVMKQVTRAYEEGDLARLVELEGAWQSEQALSEGGDPEARCRELERLNRELLDQLREVTRALRDAKHDLRDAARSHPSEELFELANIELDDLEAIRDLVRRFRDGKVTLNDLMHGPLPRPRRRARR